MNGLLLLLALVLVVVVYRAAAKRKKKPYVLPANARQLLEDHIVFYRNLGSGDKTLFEKRVTDFLSHVAITGVGVKVEELDRLLVASGAIIPIFAFPTWRYNNISEVLLYNDTFSKDYRTKGTE